MGAIDRCGCGHVRGTCQPASPTGVQAISPQGRLLGSAQTCLQHGIKEALPEVGGGGLDAWKRRWEGGLSRRLPQRQGDAHQ